MNTKIIVALVIGIALVGLTGAASAASYYGDVAYSQTDILDTETPSNLDVDSGACFKTVIGHFDGSYGYTNPDDPVHVGGGVFNTMHATPVGMGVEHQIATQGGSAAITLRSLDSEDGLPEVEAEVTSKQSLWYSGSFTEYGFLTSDKGMVGALGLLSNGLDFDDLGGLTIPQEDCGNIMLKSQSMSEGFMGIIEKYDGVNKTYGGGAKITGGTFSVETFQGMTADLEGVPAGDAIINVKGGAMGASTFEGAVDDWEGIATNIWVLEELTVDTGWTANNLEDFCVDP